MPRSMSAPLVSFKSIPSTAAINKHAEYIITATKPPYSKPRESISEPDTRGASSIPTRLTELQNPRPVFLTSVG